jgi:hypothetical protein
VRLGDEVVLLGRQGDEQISAMDVARWLGTNCYDVVCAISARVPRVTAWPVVLHVLLYDHFQHVAHPPIEALICQAGLRVNLAMQRWRHSHHEFAGKGLLRVFTTRCAERQIIVDRLAKRAPEFPDGLPFKGDHIPHIDHFSVKKTGVLVDFDFTDVPLILHHGLTPASSRNRRTDFTVALLASLRGCGR